MIKVIKAVGWIKGNNGTGVVYELEQDGVAFLANRVIENGVEPWRYLSVGMLRDHVARDLGYFSNTRPDYLSENLVAKAANGDLNVQNPDWPRIYNGTMPTEPTEPTPPGAVTEDTLSLPFSISLEGTVKIRLGGLSKIFELLQ